LQTPRKNRRKRGGKRAPRVDSSGVENKDFMALLLVVLARHRVDGFVGAPVRWPWWRSVVRREEEKKRGGRGGGARRGKREG
jgi:hypothetical protein